MCPVSEPERSALIEAAHALADAARVATLEHFRMDGLTADTKRDTDFDPVTIADRAAERRMREILAVRRPDDAIFGEEFGAQPGTSGLTWVLGPHRRHARLSLRHPDLGRADRGWHR